MKHCRRCHEELASEQEPSSSMSVSNACINSSSSGWSEELQNVVMLMNMNMNRAYNANNRTTKAWSPSLTLQENIWAWCKATGIPTSVSIHLDNHTFRLHKYPLVSKCGFLKQEFSNASEVRLNMDCEIFELVAIFCYGSEIVIDSGNIAALRCAGEMLDMSEEHFRGNLCERTEEYFNEVILKSWEDTLMVLQTCNHLLPLAEEIGIVHRCYDSLAYMACRETSSSHKKENKSSLKNPSEDMQWWMEDLVTLSPQHFEEVVSYMRTKSMDENHVTRMIILYATRHLVAINGKEDGKTHGLVQIFGCILRLLPNERYIIPCDFLFGLLRLILSWGLSFKYKTTLENRIASQLDHASMDNFLFASPSDIEDESMFASQLESMMRIVCYFLHKQSIVIDSKEFENPELCIDNFGKISVVANIWDEYIVNISSDERLTPDQFSELVGAFPESLRSSHDFLYKAINTFLMAHPHVTPEDRLAVCNFLNCEKLSPEACIHAVQNDLIPLELTVRAMCLQQLQTWRSLKSGCTNLSHLESNGNPVPFANEASDMNSYCHFLPEESRFKQLSQHGNGLSLGLILKRDAVLRQTANLRSEYEATSIRLKNLEKELLAMKKKIEKNRFEHHTVEGRHVTAGGGSQSFRVVSSRTNTGCSSKIGNTFNASTSWLSHKKSQGSFVKRMFKLLSAKKRKDNENNKTDETDSSPHVEDSVVAVEAQQVKKSTSMPRNNIHRRNHSYS